MASPLLPFERTESEKPDYYQELIDALDSQMDQIDNEHIGVGIYVMVNNTPITTESMHTTVTEAGIPITPRTLQDVDFLTPTASPEQRPRTQQFTGRRRRFTSLFVDLEGPANRVLVFLSTNVPEIEDDGEDSDTTQPYDAVQT